jgi:hypothetical protein
MVEFEDQKAAQSLSAALKERFGEQVLLAP